MMCVCVRFHYRSATDTRHYVPIKLGFFPSHSANLTHSSLRISTQQAFRRLNSLAKKMQEHQHWPGTAVERRLAAHT